MEKYSIGIAENHVIAIMNNKRVLISTGSPTSVGEMPEINILGQAHKLAGTLQGLDIKQISTSLKTDINALLGMDVMSKFVFYISHGIQAMICSDYFINFKESMHEFRIKIVDSLPIIETRIAGVAINMILDTGSKLSYLDAGLLAGMRNIDLQETFYPGAGVFVSDIYLVPIDIKGKSRDIFFGKVPENLMPHLSARSCLGILGSDIFKYYNIQFNFKNSTIWLVDKGAAR
jgi:hypothetical protein